MIKPGKKRIFITLDESVIELLETLTSLTKKDTKSEVVQSLILDYGKKMNVPLPNVTK